MTASEIPQANACLRGMAFNSATRSTCVASGADWLHEVKYDDYRLLLERNGDRVRLITRGGDNWTSRYPWIVEASRKIRQRQFVLDGEAVVLGVDGISDLNALHSRKHDHEVQFCAFDILAEGGDDLRMLPLSMRTGSALIRARAHRTARLTVSHKDFRFTLEGGHRRRRPLCPPWASTGLVHRSK